MRYGCCNRSRIRLVLDEQQVSEPVNEIVVPKHEVAFDEVQPDAFPFRDFPHCEQRRLPRAPVKDPTVLALVFLSFSSSTL